MMWMLRAEDVGQCVEDGIEEIASGWPIEEISGAVVMINQRQSESQHSFKLCLGLIIWRRLREQLLESSFKPTDADIILISKHGLNE